MWKVGSGAHLLPPFPLDLVDPVDPVDPPENSETSFFDEPFCIFGYFACGDPPRKNIFSNKYTVLQEEKSPLAGRHQATEAFSFQEYTLFEKKTLRADTKAQKLEEFFKS